MPIEVPSIFIAEFKVGDNINYNLEVVAKLYEIRACEPGVVLLNKPIVVLLASIIEAALYDLFNTRLTFTREGVKGFTDLQLESMREKRLEKFQVCIEQAKKQVIFGEATDPIYGRLHRLRDIRNRVHIQNDKGHQPAHECELFVDAIVDEAELLVERALKTLAKNHPRPKSIKGQVLDFQLPWNEPRWVE